MDVLVDLVAEYLIFAVPLLALAYWLTLGTRDRVATLVVGTITAVVAFALAKVGALLYDDPRPFVTDHVVPLFRHAADNGFPSDHTLAAAVVAAAVCYTSWRWGVAFLAVAVLIGGARVLAHVHHVTDILGSLAFAGVAGVVAAIATPHVLEAGGRIRERRSVLRD